MATDKQVAANRANARKSTGPRTEAGRRRAAQNALRHGLSIPQERDPAVRERTLHLADSILREHGNAASEQALELAAAQLDLERIGHVRSHVMLRFNLDTVAPSRFGALHPSTAMNIRPAGADVARWNICRSSTTRDFRTCLILDKTKPISA